ncbi:hypothetical protein SAMN05880590_1075 [Rhizobium sp. RU35A]|uniref:hypothetical protein n=1 Tax=Rhizobium sp. RU35A TaxID=1907414 RepID=UPI000955D49E|nr:hypothetical protein [Rhizobium sp. RU35A]SIQ75236.1 hypothetical protein SAMN05880590_1075 [Rhizobium sp. RU35A]
MQRVIIESRVNDAKRLVLAAQGLLLHSDLLTGRHGEIADQIETILMKASEDLSAAIASMEDNL